MGAAATKGEKGEEKESGALFIDERGERSEQRDGGHVTSGGCRQAALRRGGG